ncbi:transposase (fragment) [groundwater metagenome]|uniref:Transposase n=1 Tax=groundwater metagenome TaxID=717931 RepID=A0A098EG15_9ZZZZ
MALQEDTIGQAMFITTNDMVPKDHICNLVAAIVKEIDVNDVEEKYVGTPGNPAYSRKMLLRLLVQASIDGIWASRDIDKLARENFIYVYLTGNKKPDFRTICLFRKDNKELIERTFKKVVAVAHGLGILNLGHLSTDGTKIKANASNNRVLSKEDIEWIKEIIEKGIKVDDEEDKLYGDRRGDELPQELSNPEKLKEKIREKIKELEKIKEEKLRSSGKKLVEKHAMGNEKQKKKIEEKLEKISEEMEKSKQKAVSVTDPEARFMKNKKDRKELSFNPQITVDHNSGIIVANEVTQDCTDHYQLKPQIEMTEKNVGKLPEGTKISNDNGYFNGPNLRYLEKKKLDGYIPDSKQTQEMKNKKLEETPYSKDKFEYDEKRDCFICP